MSDCEHIFSFRTMEKPSSGHVVREIACNHRFVKSNHHCARIEVTQKRSDFVATPVAEKFVRPQYGMHVAVIITDGQLTLDDEDDSVEEIG
ncbi:hypothetical protein T01_1702 [Trichinella spiralis]|uniref:Uncharacterized protein n=1 Tax=Trichinella spiralis TaxID=6334 RepID=A0A0V1B7T5_TRISP|nr:hypothetical protein T01_1702 [Trichinella spiralis]